MMSRARAIVRDEGFVVNEDKGRVERAAGRQRVTGIVVNDKLGLPREELRRLRAILHRAKTTGLAAQNRDGRPTSRPGCAARSPTCTWSTRRAAPSCSRACRRSRRSSRACARGERVR